MSSQDLESKVAELEARVRQLDQALFSTWAVFLPRMSGSKLYEVPAGVERYTKIKDCDSVPGRFLTPRTTFSPEEGEE